MLKRIKFEITEEYNSLDMEGENINSPIFDLTSKNINILSIRQNLENVLTKNGEKWIISHIIWKYLFGDVINPELCTPQYNTKNNFPELILDDNMKGFILLNHFKNDKEFNCDMEIYFAFTSENYRNKGIMKALFERLKDKYPDKSFVLVSDDDHKTFWEKMGFLYLKSYNNDRHVYLFNSNYIDIPLDKFKVEMPYGCDYNEEENEVMFHNREYNDLGCEKKVLKKLEPKLNKHIYFYRAPRFPLNSLNNFQEYEKMLRKFKNYKIIGQQNTIENPYYKLVEYLYCIEKNKTNN